MNFEKLKIVEINTQDGKLLSIQEDFGQEDDPDLAMAGVWNPSSKGEAYAKLFAAAPELLEALEIMLPLAIAYGKSFGANPDEDVDFVRAKAALAKAKGEQA